MTLCECGCGRETTIYHGKHRRFISGHTWKGKHHTEETKRKCSEVNLGRKLSVEHKMKMSETAKNRMTPEVREELSELQRGEKASNWQGGISFEPYCAKFNKQFKESVREKFNRTCFLCGTPENGRKLDVHHVNYDKECLCSDIKCEFVPLCSSCHGKTSHNRTYYEELILEKLEELKC